MKKVKMFIISVIILFLSGNLAYMYVYHHPSYEIQTLKGDSSIWNDVKFQMDVKVSMLQDDGGISKFTYEHGKNSLVIEKQNALLAQNDISSNRFYINMEYRNPKHVMKDWTKEEGRDTSIKTYEQADIQYFISYANKGIVELNPNMTIYSNDDYTVIERKYAEDSIQVELDNQKESIFPFDTAYAMNSKYEATIVEDGSDCYFIPYRDEYIKGSSYIYKIYEEGNSLKQRTLVKLPDDQKELMIDIYQHQIIMIVERNNQLYVQKYDEQGNLMKEVALHMDKDEFIRYSIHENQLHVISGNQYVTIDLDQVVRINLTTVSSDLEMVCTDLLYRNDILYLIGYEHLENEGMNVMLYGIKDDQIIYQGKIPLYGEEVIYPILNMCELMFV